MVLYRCEVLYVQCMCYSMIGRRLLGCCLMLWIKSKTQAHTVTGPEWDESTAQLRENCCCCWWWVAMVTSQASSANVSAGCRRRPPRIAALLPTPGDLVAYHTVDRRHTHRDFGLSHSRTQIRSNVKFSEGREWASKTSNSRLFGNADQSFQIIHVC